MHADYLDAIAADRFCRAVAAAEPKLPAAPPPRLIDLGAAAPDRVRHVVIDGDDDAVEVIAALALHYLAADGAATVEQMTLHGLDEAEIRALQPRWRRRVGEIAAQRAVSAPHRLRLRVAAGSIAGAA